MADSFDKSNILGCFVAEARSYLPRIRANVERLAADPEQERLREEGHRLAHAVKNSSLMMGYPDLSRVVQPIELFLDGSAEGKARLGLEAVATICRSLDRAAIILDGLQGEWIDGERIMQENDGDFERLQDMLRSRGLGNGGQGMEVESLSSSATAVSPELADMPAEEPPAEAEELAGPALVMSWEQIEGILAETAADEDSQVGEEAGPLPSAGELSEETGGLLDTIVVLPSRPSWEDETVPAVAVLPWRPDEDRGDSAVADPLWLPRQDESEIASLSEEYVADSPPDVISNNIVEASPPEPAGNRFADALAQLEEGRVRLESFFRKLQELLAEADQAIGDLVTLKPSTMNMSLIANRRCAQAFSAAENLARPLADIVAEMDGLTPVSLAMENVQTVLEQAADELAEPETEAIVKQAEQDSDAKAPESPTERGSASESEVSKAVPVDPARGLGRMAAEGEFAAEEEARRRQAYEQELHARLSAEIRAELTAQFARAARVPIGRDPVKSRRPTEVDISVDEEDLTADLPQELLDTFRLEAEDHLLAIGRDLVALEVSTSNGDALRDLRRSVHTLKGAAASMGFRVTGETAHILEDLLDAADAGRLEVSPPILGLILDTSSALETLVASALARQKEDRALLAALEPRYREILSSLDANGQERCAPIAIVETRIGGEPTQTAKTGALQVHVAVAQMDEAMSSVGEMVTNRAAFAQHTANLKQALVELTLGTSRLKRLSHDLGAMQGTAGALGARGQGSGVSPPSPQLRPLIPDPAARGHSLSSVPYDRADFDELELDRYTAFDHLIREMTEAVSDVGTVGGELEALTAQLEMVSARQNRLNTELQDKLRRLRLVPLSGLAPRLHRAVRNTALALGKEVEFALLGSEVEVDKLIFEAIGDPLLHLMRNAVDHGIEPPAERLAVGKAARGKVTLEACYEGSDLVLKVGDDGRGISRSDVYQRALARGLIGEGDQLSDSQLDGLLYRPGFSTASEVSETSGRGMGLDIVQALVTQMRGTVQVESIAGERTAFTIRLPLTVAVDRALLVKVGSETFAVPLGQIERILRLDKQDLSNSGPDDHLDLGEQTYPLLRLGQALDLPASASADAKTAPILIAGLANRRVAVAVDEVIGQQEIVAKALGSQFRSLAGFSGATILGNGQVVMILDIGGFPVGVPSEAALWTPREVASPPSLDGLVSLNILLVDDSPSVRRVVSNMLRKAGFEPQVARDGIEALETIQTSRPNAILLDIEMPRMDGYELLGILRSQREYENIPVVILTSRSGNKHRQKALQLGANGYLVKPYKDEELISLLRSLASARP
ncbi:MAG: response regulator [Chloroflexi bacterium]|nr:response regulator [Chloroflexota bacterium]